ncbi:hypothetical protein [uncultured Xanthomonas sp.]|uniref:hypothetical protein n=1 Tax=uncultured Xanthomonas sp. TaxID=152831 RepID=UPI0025FFA1CD|nr:hypothetical protein [uncultured Xanthomonas sp.]
MTFDAEGGDIAMGRSVALQQPVALHRQVALDVTGEELPAALIERYLAVKRDGLL